MPSGLIPPHEISYRSIFSQHFVAFLLIQILLPKQFHFFIHNYLFESFGQLLFKIFKIFVSEDLAIYEVFKLISYNF